MPRATSDTGHTRKLQMRFGGAALLVCVLVYLIGFAGLNPVKFDRAEAEGKASTSDLIKKVLTPPVPKLDTVDFDARMEALANNPKLGTTTATTTKKTLWPAKTVYPNAGAILPFKRVVAYYGNFYSKGMGVLGQYPPETMLAKLQSEVAVWNAADPTTPVLPAIHYIAVTAQGSAGKDGKYRLRMPDDQIDKAIALANQIHGIVFLDIQVALSDLPHELPIYENYFKMPNVHLGIDPEFSMKTGKRPGTVIGTMDAVDVNYAAQYLAKLVKENNLPPKILVIHRFTENMVTNYQNIEPLPEVEIVMDMDGWGFAAKKIHTYQQVIVPEPVQFTGFKLFYKNDLLPPSTRMLTPAELLKLRPIPIYIQYQ